MSSATANNPIEYNVNHPFLAKVIENYELGKAGGSKETRHLVIDVTGSDFNYTCGDSLGIFPTNRIKDVNEMLQVLGKSGLELVELPRVDSPVTLKTALRNHLYFLSGPSKKLVLALREKVTDLDHVQKLDHLLSPDNAEELKEYLAERHFIDVLEEFDSASFEAQEAVALFKKLSPRLYSIASGPSVNPNHIHLTIAAVRYEALGKERVGVASTFNIERVPLHEPVLPVFMTRSKFSLPDSDRDLIMVGPGTGIAPFRSFLQEREATSSSGRNWLFFGGRNKSNDYLYANELEAWRESGLLSHLDLAWSRDQETKVYVQDLIRAKKDEFWDWFDAGAVLSVCGDKENMSKDVEKALVDIAIEKGAVLNDPAEIKKWIRQLKKDGRYQLDVY